MGAERLHQRPRTENGRWGDNNGQLYPIRLPTASSGEVVFAVFPQRNSWPALWSHCAPFPSLGAVQFAIMAAPGAEEKIYVAADDARDFVQNVLVANGVPMDNATVVARCLIAADLRGVDTHGMNRIPSYLERIRRGVLDGSAMPDVKQITPVVTQVDARNGWGFVAADAGMAAAIESAKVNTFL